MYTLRAVHGEADKPTSLLDATRKLSPSVAVTAMTRCCWTATSVRCLPALTACTTLQSVPPAACAYMTADVVERKSLETERCLAAGALTSGGSINDRAGYIDCGVTQQERQRSEHMARSVGVDGHQLLCTAAARTWRD